MSHQKYYHALQVIFLLLSLVISACPNPVRAAAGDLHTVSGVVRDATPGGHTWPLYARIDIEGFSGSPIFTDPVSGAYSVALEEGTSYNFTVSAVNAGYQPAMQAVSIPTGDLEVNFGLSVEPVACEAQGYGLVDHWTENFDSVTAPDLPVNWASVDVGTYNDTDWMTRGTVTFYSNSYPATSSPNLVYFYENYARSRLYRTLPIDMLSLQNHILSFWMFHYGGLSNAEGFLQVQVSTDDALTWVNVGPKFPYLSDKTGWKKHILDLSAYAGQSALLLGFLADTYDSYSGSINLDTLSLGATCEAMPGALLTGRVSDVNTGASLNDVKIETSLAETISQATPLDAGLEDGYYSVFAPAGDSIALAASKIPYHPLSMTLPLAVETLVKQDLQLTAGRVAPNPVEITQTLPMNSTAVRTLNLNDTGSASANFILSELNRPMQDAPQPSNRLASVDQPAAGEILSSFSTGLQHIAGLAYNTFTGDLWLQDLQDTTSQMVKDNRLVRFLPDGTNTGDIIVSDSNTNWTSDLAFNSMTDSLWQPGLSTCNYEIDPVSRKATGNSICLPSWGVDSIAFDPITNTYFGGRMDNNIPSRSFIYRFTPDGQILETATVNLRIWGITYNPSSGHLFVTTGRNVIYVLDVDQNYEIVNEINVSSPDYLYFLGIELDCKGSLWVVDDGYQMKVDEIASGESGACDWMGIPWLNEDATSGTISAGGTQPVTLTFDAAGLMPGTYKAQLNVSHDTPYAVARLPIAMTVTLAEGFGGITGMVNGLEPCDVNPAALPDALVEIIPMGQTNPVYTTTPNAEGQYGWATPTGGSYTVRVSAEGYISQSAAFTLTIDQTQTQDFTLRRNLSCITSSAPSIHAILTRNAIRGMEITLTNRGAIDDNVVLTERAASATPALSMPAESLLTEGFEAKFPPPNWQIVPGNSNIWLSWVKNNMMRHSGVNSAFVMYDTTNQKNEWLLTPEFSLISGSLSFWSQGSISMCRVDNTCDFNIWLVVGDPGGGDDIFVGRGEDVWTADSTWAQSTFDLTPLLPDSPVRIGFQYSGSPVGSLALDDILLEGIEGIDIPWLSESPTSAQIPANGGSQTIALTFNSNGLEIGSFPAVLHFVSEKGASFDVPVTLLVFGTEKKVFLPLTFR